MCLPAVFEAFSFDKPFPVVFLEYISRWQHVTKRCHPPHNRVGELVEHPTRPLELPKASFVVDHFADELEKLEGEC
jgi:hypothetical protein